jgi:hypothetical protein
MIHHYAFAKRRPAEELVVRFITVVYGPSVDVIRQFRMQDFEKLSHRTYSGGYAGMQCNRVHH